MTIYITELLRLDEAAEERPAEELADFVRHGVEATATSPEVAIEALVLLGRPRDEAEERVYYCAYGKG